jgi:nitrogen fixation/metabolism regulation signal transduction histidine kinase
MGFDARFTLALVGWLTATMLALAAFAAACVTPGLAAVRLVTGVAAVGAVTGLLWHVNRTNRMLAAFLEALHHREFAARFDSRGGAGFASLAAALDTTMQRLQGERLAGERTLRFLEALVDDTPVAMLTIDAEHGVRPANKVARRLLDRHPGTRPADFAIYGATLAERLAQPAGGTREILLLRLPGGLQRTIVRTASLERLGSAVHLVSLEPVQGTLDSVEVAAQTDLVRVLTHEILNSLTPVMSLARTVDTMLAAPAPDLDAVRQATGTLARRTEGLRSFIDSYRAVARTPEPRPVTFAAAPFAQELARLFGVEWPGHQLALHVDVGMTICADPDLLAQALINLLRNAAQASAHLALPQVRLALAVCDGRTVIEVEDNGGGIPQERRADVFLPFYTTRPEGSGVGLNLVRQIAVASGWAIEIASGALGGALLRITFRPGHAPATSGPALRP